MHRNDLENIPAFLAIGLIFVAINPSLLVAQLLLYRFVVTFPLECNATP
jgi:glutathione S-transferase